MNTVYTVWLKQGKIFVMWSIHKTIDGATAEMNKHQVDGYVMNYNLHD